LLSVNIEDKKISLRNSPINPPFPFIVKKNESFLKYEKKRDPETIYSTQKNKLSINNNCFLFIKILVPEKNSVIGIKNAIKPVD
tara:strand:+ start:1090 stop:1341 length:252 start_codon:yes stop_codon:yes gene_type:complete